MRRREFITLVVGAAGWPLAVHAQQPERMRRVGVLLAPAADDPDALARVAAFTQGLQQAGWSIGQNLRIDIRWGAGSSDNIRKHAAELVALAPDVVLVGGAGTLAALQQASRSVPTVFVQVIDPVAGGFIDNMAQPGGNATGFTTYEFGMSAKWLELLKEFAPRVTRVAVLRDPTLPGGIGQLAAIQSVAPNFGVVLSPVNVRNASEIERAVAAFARTLNSGLIMTGGPLTNIHRKLIAELAVRHRLPLICANRIHVTAGGLASYGVDFIDQHRRAAGYVDRILKGERPADLPVQAPTKYELVINLKTAKALGIAVPPTLLARADEVIE